MLIIRNEKKNLLFSFTPRKHPPRKNCTRPWFQFKDSAGSMRFWVYFPPVWGSFVHLHYKSKTQHVSKLLKASSLCVLCNLSHTRGTLAIILSYGTVVTTTATANKRLLERNYLRTPKEKKWLAFALLIFHLPSSAAGSGSSNHGAQSHLFIYIPPLRCARCKHA